MVRKYAVAIISFFENENKVFIVLAPNEREAMIMGLKAFGNGNADSGDWADTLPEDIDAIKQECFNGEIGISSPILVD
jgi:hypothetical protein